MNVLGGSRVSSPLLDVVGQEGFVGMVFALFQQVGQVSFEVLNKLIVEFFAEEVGYSYSQSRALKAVGTRWARRAYRRGGWTAWQVQ